MRDEEQSPPDAADAPAAKQSIGETLRATREFRRASIEYVSELLRIEPRFLVALEEERFAAIGPPVFVKGYLKHYAELLGLDPRPLLDELRERLGREEPPLQARRSAEQGKEPSSRAAVGIGAAAVVLVAVTVAVWQLGGLDFGRESGAGSDVAAAVDASASASTPAPGATVESTLELPTAPGLPRPAASAVDSSGRTERIDGAAVSAASADGPAGGGVPSVPASTAVGRPAGVTGGGAESERTAAAEQQTSPVPAGADEPAAPAAERAPSGADRAVVATVADRTSAGVGDRATGVGDRATAPVGAGPAAGESALEIELRFVEDSWTEVTSSGGERLFYGLGRAGVEERIRANDEVRVLLGNAQGVVVSVNGEPFAYPAGSRSGDLARFRLSPEN